MGEEPNHPAVQLGYSSQGADHGNRLEVNARNLVTFFASTLLTSVALAVACWTFLFIAFLVHTARHVGGAIPILLVCAALWTGWVTATRLRSPAVFFGVVSACWALLLAANFYGLLPLHSF